MWGSAMVMKRATRVAAIGLVVGLAGCDGNPFTGDPDTGTGDTSSNAIYGSTLNDDLKMNSMAYDATNDQLVVNNIPFDGATAGNGQAVYARQGGLGATGFGRYENVAGELNYYAVFRRSDSGAVEGGAFQTGDYVTPGPGGAAVRRNGDVSLPDSGEYTFTGEYAAVRSFDASSTAPVGVQYVTGRSSLAIDFGDYDGVGAVIGRVTGRNLYAEDGSLIGPMDDYVTFAAGEIDRDNGKISGGTVLNRDDTGELGTGSWSAVIGGPNGTEVAGIIVFEGQGSGTSGDTMRETGILIATRP